MATRRDFLKQAALLTGTAAVWGVLPESIQRAFAIDPETGSTFLDAEHVVVLMQENRSFDHCYGALQGVRGFNDPRAFTLPNGNPVWLQSNAAGETYAPFRLDIKETKATWMGSLPHSWENQVAARNNGRYDRWLSAKASGDERYSHLPLTLGYYTREDIPFYYAFADAFTVCDQHFCSSLTGTTPNRLFLWTGTIREKPDPASPAKVYNEEADYDHEVSWTTFPERLEDQGISWKIYQNEISTDTGFEGEEDPWLSNFGDNPIEYFSQFQVRFAAAHRAHLEKLSGTLPAEIDALKGQVAALPAGEARTALEKQLKEKTDRLAEVTTARGRWNQANYDRLSPREKRLHEKAFCNNAGDPQYRTLERLSYRDGGIPRTVLAPKGDVLYQFREDVNRGALPTVSWLVGPERLSDHPSSAWYGAWYVSEILDILTRNPEVWKKTILILTYDENDGYFDHVPPFVAPHPSRTETGRTSPAIDTAVDYIDHDQDLRARPGYPPQESAIGLGYRVPMVIASPWSRGGCVCSEVFDHTSPLQFLETFLTQKTGKPITESNISPWRRTICGDLTSAFQPYHGESVTSPAFPPRDTFIEGIHRAQFKGIPSNYHGLTPEEIARIRRSPVNSPLLPKQEPGIRRSAALPYELYADGTLSADRSHFAIRLAAGNAVFGKRATGAPFNAYAYHGPDHLQARTYAVAAGDTLSDSWAVSDFTGSAYHVRIDGPNGFHRSFQGATGDPAIAVEVRYTRSRSGLTGAVEVHLTNQDSREHTITVTDNAYGTGEIHKTLPAGGTATVTVATRRSHGWYDIRVRVANISGFEYRYAGRVETGMWSYSDPAMGGATA